MRKLDLTSYPVGQDETGRAVMYDVVPSLAVVLFHQSNNLGALDLMKRQKLLEKIEKAAEKGSVLLEDAEFAEVESTFKTIRGFGKNDVELVRRVLEAPTVQVEEK